MWQRGISKIGGVKKFFYVGLSHDSLINHYYTNFALIQHHKYSLAELDNMIPFERKIYVDLLLQHLKEEKERLESQNV